MALEQTWRWFGPNDPISLNEIKQCGATGIVTALHHIPYGELWSVDEILKRKNIIENAGLRWSVVESVPVHEDIKKRKGNYNQYIENYKQTIRNLGKCGLDTICYNFMPVLDWSRTELESKYGDGSIVSEYKQVIFTAFELFILKKTGDEAKYSETQIAEAKRYFDSMSETEMENLKKVVLLSLPGTDEPVSLEYLYNAIEEYKGISREKLKEHLKLFIKEIIPVAEECGIRMAIHPDDPPRPVFGLPRIVSTLQDLKDIVGYYDSPANGITLCTGSLGAGSFNNCPLIAKELAHRINFTHLRNVVRDEKGDFREDYVFAGDIDITEVMKVLILEEEKRKKDGRKDWQIPLRPDHGNQMLGDIGRKFYPGYSLYGRMKNLAELRGLEIGLRNTLIEK
jgi:mannonate dehydratase